LAGAADNVVAAPTVVRINVPIETAKPDRFIE
jgi:hypothetical protein